MSGFATPEGYIIILEEQIKSLRAENEALKEQVEFWKAEARRWMPDEYTNWEDKFPHPPEV